MTSLPAFSTLGLLVSKLVRETVETFEESLHVNGLSSPLTPWPGRRVCSRLGLLGFPSFVGPVRDGRSAAARRA